ncbi:zinc ABC transporter substrate-binding protein [Halomonas denitrificans]|uniref:zinc ABC transporter substrate-binding protein n=1 Tax=Halomonas denitrificans TaxID=370769 RepID=UPI001CD49A6D|nr:zinc ABC transporter substrate-binding protein [Halomonas denitrificans]MCA0974814.1 zinc ABC transporter substrate-binding protein [Halomonas denitrificans]
MKKPLLRPLCLPWLLTPAIAVADVPNVAVDIPPVHALVAQVMGELGSPELVIQPGASPHGYSMRPSEAQALASADAVFWVSDSLTPWLERARTSLADGAREVELMEAPGTVTLAYRQGATFEAHDHGDHEDHEDHEDHDHDGHEHGDHDHGEHDEHGDHDHADHDHDHADHDHDHADHDHDQHTARDHEHGHAHDGMDPHGWLDPVNAKAWLDTIATTLAELDPEHAATYRQNAANGQADLDELIQRLDNQLDDARGVRFIVFHDAYQYFENRFAVPASGAISLGDASDPSPARIREIQTRVSDDNIQCVFREPQFNPALIDSVFEGTEVNTSIVMDPLGVDLDLGPGLYSQLLQRLADGMTDCTKG